MTKIKILVTLIICSLAGFAIASNVDIVERIKAVGEVCIQGEDCASGAATTVVVADTGGGVQSNYNASCATCHNAGVAGAPKLGDVDEWAKRVEEQGIDALYAASINGIPPAMPAKGMCFSCSDDDLRALVDYMIAESK